MYNRCITLSTTESNNKNNRNTSNTRLMCIRIPLKYLQLIEKCANRDNISISKTINRLIRKGFSMIDIENKIDALREEQNLYSISKKIGAKSHNLYVEQEQKLKNLNKTCQDQINQTNYIKTFIRDNFQCRKCGSKSNIIDIKIPDYTLYNNEPELNARITLCKKCYDELRIYIPKKYELERFLDWFYP